MTLLKIILFSVLQCGLGGDTPIFHILYIIVAPLCPAFLKRVDLYKVHQSEKRGVR